MPPDLTDIIPNIIAVGSTNPVKIKAVEHTLQALTANKLTIISRSAQSGVSEQPFSDTETRQGAINRAFDVLGHTPSAKWGIGLEGGVRQISYQTQKGRVVHQIIEVAWCAIVDKKGNIALGGGVQFQLPPIITQKLKAGGELGPVMDKLVNGTDIKKKQGAIGILSQKLLTRQHIYRQICKLALVKIISQHLHPNWWKNPVNSANTKSPI
ncbi:MAG: DUF84 family protein [bacterium]|nr:DUF84 family protein [bacterium]